MGKLTKVLYNGDCSVCSLEIKQYKKYSDTRLLDIEFEDLNDTDLDKWGVTKDEATKRMHVESNGKIYSGVDEFIKLWEEMPRYNILARLAKTPGLYEFGNILYDKVLAPALYNKNKLKEMIYDTKRSGRTRS